MDMENGRKEGLLADLLAKAKEGKGLDFAGLRDVIRKEIETGDKVFGKFLMLVESFQQIIPEEKQRFNAAVQALSATAGLTRQNVLDAADHQLQELKVLEKAVLAVLPGLHDEFRAMETRAREIKEEMARLREEIAQIEKEEKEILAGMATREREMKTTEESLSNLFTDIGAHIRGIRQKLEEFSAEKTSMQAAATPDSVERQESREERGMSGEEASSAETSAEQEMQWVKKCPLCEGKMNFHVKEAMWMCYTCGHEELANGSSEDEGEAPSASEPMSAAEPVPAVETQDVAGTDADAGKQVIPAAFSPVSVPVDKSSTKKKTCPSCRKQMEWVEKEKSWICPFCGYRRMVF